MVTRQNPSDAENLPKDWEAVLVNAAAALAALTAKGRRQARNRRYYLKRKARRASENVLNQTVSDGLERHRGLSYLHMPGRSESKKSTFALFKRNLWPPKKWKVPAEMIGAPLMMCLHEAAANSNRRKSQ